MKMKHIFFLFLNKKTIDCFSTRRNILVWKTRLLPINTLHSNRLRLEKPSGYVLWDFLRLKDTPGPDSLGIERVSPFQQMELKRWTHFITCLNSKSSVNVNDTEREWQEKKRIEEIDEQAGKQLKKIKQKRSQKEKEQSGWSGWKTKCFKWKRTWAVSE